MTEFAPYSLLLPFLLYAETHYRFRYFFSYLKKREPEILTDAPHWLEPDRRLPLLILIKDAHLYPCTLFQITALVHQEGRVIGEVRLLDSPVELHSTYWWCVFTIDLELHPGWVEVDVTFELEVRGKRLRYKNDNYRTSSHAPLHVYKGREPLPRFKGVELGDCHTHSTFTEDQVEFGSPLEASVQLCKSMGLSFFCVTDHSYDLDDKLDSYLQNDPTLPKWKALQQSVDTLNSKGQEFAIIRGEEVSCRNSVGQNVHLVLLGNKDYVPGSGDSAERWFHTRSELRIGEILSSLDKQTIAIAAHPNEKVPLIQRLLLGRGEWTNKDLSDAGLMGIQFVNGARDGGYLKGYRLWIECLLQGQRLYAFGGNDAHGNFNRFRQIGIPFFRIRESDRQLFGKARTAIFLRDARVTETAIISSLKSGCAVVTDGPLLNMRVQGSNDVTVIGNTITVNNVVLEFEGRSSVDYGSFEKILIYRGMVGARSEDLLYSYSERSESTVWGTRLEILVDQLQYIRAEAVTSSEGSYDKQSHFVLTNPVWLKPS